MQEVTSGIIDQMQLSSGSSTLCMEVQTSSSFKDLLLTIFSKCGLEWHGYHSQFISLGHV
jgi:hypothetical protein